MASVELIAPPEDAADAASADADEVSSITLTRLDINPNLSVFPYLGSRLAGSCGIPSAVNNSLKAIFLSSSDISALRISSPLLMTASSLDAEISFLGALLGSTLSVTPAPMLPLLRSLAAAITPPESLREL